MERKKIVGRVHSWFPPVLRVGLGALFIYSGIVKALAPGAFLVQVENYEILPHVAAVCVSLYLPFLEVLCGSALILRRFDRGGLLLLGAMMAVFMLALGSAWARGLNIECGCFGLGGGRGRYALDLGRDALIVAGLVVLWRKKIDSFAS